MSKIGRLAAIYLSENCNFCSWSFETDVVQLYIFCYPTNNIKVWKPNNHKNKKKTVSRQRYWYRSQRKIKIKVDAKYERMKIGSVCRSHNNGTWSSLSVAVQLHPLAWNEHLTANLSMVCCSSLSTVVYNNKEKSHCDTEKIRYETFKLTFKIKSVI